MITPALTIITVTYQAEKFLEETILSVQQQSFRHFEHLIVDGKSTDGTLQIIQKYQDSLRWVSEKDAGLYDAMNKAILMAKGEWVMFLNAGDTFYHPDSLTQVFAPHYQKNHDLIYGRVFFKNHPSGVDYIGQNKIRYQDYFFSIPLCHQAALIKKELFSSIGLYNLEYKILADQEWFVRYFKQGDHSLYIPEVLSAYEIVGLSQKQRFKSIKENQKISRMHFPWYIHFIRTLRHPFLLFKVYLMMKLMHTKGYAWYRSLFHRGLSPTAA